LEGGKPAKAFPIKSKFPSKTIKFSTKTLVSPKTLGFPPKHRFSAKTLISRREIFSRQNPLMICLFRRAGVVEGGGAAQNIPERGGGQIFHPAQRLHSLHFLPGNQTTLFKKAYLSSFLIYI
jgi:hypothetical protein